MKAIEWQSVTLSRGGRVVIRDLTAEIAAGEFVGVFGPNGAGKTTLLSAVLGLLPTSAGRVSVFGKPPGDGTLIGYMPQRRSEAAELGLRGWDFVAAACNGARWGLPILGSAGRRDVARVLELVEASELARRSTAELSGGELQRLLLAQALLGEPRLLLLDEPLMSLDPRRQRSVVELVRRVQRKLGIAVLFTAHEINPLLPAMDRVLYLGHGQAAIGRVEEVVTSAVLSRLYGSPIDVLHVGGRILAVSSDGEIEAEVHRHDDDHGHGHHHA